MTGELVPTGRLTVCCRSHCEGPLGACCDPEDCEPCCVECPSCPRCAFYERFQPGWRKQTAADHRRWQVEYWGDRHALVEVGEALWFWDRGNPRFAVLPDLAQVVRTVRKVNEALWGQEMPF